MAGDPSHRAPWRISGAIAPFIPGTAHALTTVAVGYPFDTVKTRLQVGMHKSAWDCVKSTASREGPLALYRGALMPLASLTVKRPFEFAVWEWFNSHFGGRSRGPFVGGFIAGIVSSLLGCPFNVVKVQMQTHKHDIYRHTFEACGEVWRQKGILGFYRGLHASLIMNVPSTTFYLGAYGSLREALPKSKWSTAFAGAISSLAMWTCLIPLDNVRTNIQSRSFKPDADAVILSWREQFLEIIRARGVLGLWAGWTPAAMRAPIVSALAMLAYEQARSAAATLSNE